MVGRALVKVRRLPEKVSRIFAFLIWGWLRNCLCVCGRMLGIFCVRNQGGLVRDIAAPNVPMRHRWPPYGAGWQARRHYTIIYYYECIITACLCRRKYPDVRARARTSAEHVCAVFRVVVYRFASVYIVGGRFGLII